MKKIALLFIIILAFGLIFSACDKPFDEPVDEPIDETPVETATFMFHDGEDIVGNITIQIDGLETVFDAIKSPKYAEQIDADYTEGGQGTYINSIYGIIPNLELEDSMEYISFCHTQNDYASDWGGPIEINGTIFLYSDKSVDEVPLLNGTCYLFILEVYIY